MTKAEIKATLDATGVKYKASSTKADLEALVPPIAAVFTLTLKKGAAFKAVGIADFTLSEGDTREVEEATARSIEGLFEKGVLPSQLRSHLIVGGLNGD